MEGGSDRDLELWWGLASVQRRVSRDLNRTLLKGQGYPAIWMDVLIALAGTPDGRDLIMGLAGKLGDRRGMTLVVNRMTRAGLVRRRHDPTDHRRALIILTARGRRELQRALPRYRAAIRQTGLGNLTAPEGRALQRLLRKVNG